MLQEQAKTVSVIPKGEIQSHSRYVFVRVMFIIGLVLLVLSLAVGGHSGDLVGPARWGITHVYEGSVISFDWDSRNLNQ